MNNDVVLQVNGANYAGWLTVSVTAGIERQARDFSVDITRNWPDGPTTPPRIIPGDSVQVFIGEDLVLTGYVDAMPVSYDALSITTGISGRSKTADLVDCAAIHAGGQWNNRKVEQIAADLASRYGVNVLAAVDTGAAVESHQIEPGETVFDSIDRLLELRALLSTDDEAGRVILTRAGSGGAASPLILGENILSGSASLNFSGRFSEYICKGQNIGSNADSGAAVSEVEGRAIDDGVSRTRSRIIDADGQATLAACRDLARWSAVTAAGQSLEATYTVAGWRQADGRLWRPNEQIEVRDPVIGFSSKMIIAEVNYSLNENGMITTLVVAPKEAYELPPSTGAAVKKDDWAGYELIEFG